MIYYYGSKISPHMTKTPEGYLICHDVPIARTGWQDYLGEEIGIEEKRGQIVKVYRSPEEVFSKATMASFEGKPTTNNHPPLNINIDTIANYARGHAQNVRQDGDFLIADLHNTDPGLIAEIENGKREVSCGYDCLWVPRNDGTYEQKEIRGNHVAIVQNGRAGSRVAIKDEDPIKNKQTERRKRSMKKGKNTIISKVLSAFAKDAEPEELAEAMDALTGEGGTDPTETKEAEQTGQILEAIKGLASTVNGLVERVSALEQSDKQVHQEVGADAELSALEKEMSTADEEPGSETIEEEKKEEEKPAPAADSMKNLIAKMKPAIMAIQDAKVRDAVAKEFVAAVRDSRDTGVNGYANILNAANQHKKIAMDASKTNIQTVDQRAIAQAEAWNKARNGGK